MCVLRVVWLSLLACASFACDGEDTYSFAEPSPAVTGSHSDSGVAPSNAAGQPNCGASSCVPGAGGAPASVPPSVPASDVGGTRSVASPSRPLPDLVLDAAYLRDTTALDEVSVDDVCLVNAGCVTGEGRRRVVRFGSRIGNIGDADFIIGAPAADNPLWTLNACHQTLELLDFARYELIDAATGAIILVGVKNGFCVSDSEEWSSAFRSYCPQVYDCSRQGISPGCADNYGSALQCQWVDITDIPAGDYELRVTINASRSVPESDYTNNVVSSRLRIANDGIAIEP
jgi:lysyl oxidase